ncbi:LOW QUALITY PROTEIN: hypothetical protein OSB04_012031, partial [Centaurea solstitialis]
MSVSMNMFFLIIHLPLPNPHQRSDSPYISIFPNPPPGFPTEPTSPPPSPIVPLPHPEPTSPPTSPTTTTATLPTTPTLEPYSRALFITKFNPHPTTSSPSAVTNKWSLCQLDIQTTFLHGDLQEMVYMRQRSGFVDLDRPDYVCLLNKSLYGLEQAPRAWFTKLSTALHQLGFYGFKTNPSLFILNSSGTLVYILVYVDDIIITGSGSTTLFLGIEMVHHGSDLVLSQRTYVLGILHRAGLADCKLVSSPMSTSQVFLHDDNPLLRDPSRYRQIVGDLQYATLSRPDIAFAINKVCQFMHAPTENHCGGVKRILRHTQPRLTVSSQHEVSFKPFLTLIWLLIFELIQIQTRLAALSIVDPRGDMLSIWVQILFHGPFANNELFLDLQLTELIWLKSLLHELCLDSNAPTLWCDNLGATYLSENLVFHARTKHVKVDYHFVREQVTQGKPNVKFISTHDQIDDVFTKPLSSQRFEFLRSKLSFPALNLRGR